jgi:hypothetical protein
LHISAKYYLSTKPLYLFYIQNGGLSDFLAVILKKNPSRRKMLAILSNRPLEIYFSGKAIK